MAIAEIIGAAIGVLLLVVVAYVLVGATISAAETLGNAQKDLTLQNEARIGTNLHINETGISTSSGLTFSVQNKGNEIVSDFTHMTLFTSNATKEWQYYVYDAAKTGNPGNWTITSFNKENSDIHPNELDPGEEMWIRAAYVGDPPLRFQITTGNGVSAPWAI